MGTILLDEDFYEETYYDGYIEDLISFIEKYFEIDVSVFHPYCHIGNSWAKKNMLSVIQLKLQKTGKLDIQDSNLINPISDGQYDILNFTPEFIGKINYLLQIFDNVIVPVTKSKHNHEIKNPYANVYIVNHIREETDSNIARFIKDKMFIENIVEPVISMPLPNYDICRDYLEVQNEMIKNGNDRLITYSTVAREVAFRNGYFFDKKVTDKNKNSKQKREIYNFNSKQYLSTDFENGCFEVYNSRGKHLGEYSYIGKQLSCPDETGKHDIKV